ncbi:hypothetical protein NL676_025734 [Syzygium grande]|nr:hypothetical protein NL676_025734 [Syzygium grande]
MEGPDMGAPLGGCQPHDVTLFVSGRTGFIRRRSLVAPPVLPIWIDPSIGRPERQSYTELSQEWLVVLGNPRAGHPKALLAQATITMMLAQECPVCKALIEEEKLVPLYGRGKSSSDPRSKSVPGVNIPHRPTGQRPETAPPPPPPEPNLFHQHGLGFRGGSGGFGPMATARFGNFTLSAAFGGLFPSSLFNFQLHGFPDAAMYGASPGFPFGYPHTFHGGHHHAHVYHHHPRGQGQQDVHLKMLLLVIAVCVAFALFLN